MLYRLELKEGVFKALLEEAKSLTPEQRGELLLKDNSESEAYKLIATHQELAMEGQTEANPHEKVNYHFVALVERGGFLYELDGRKEFPINHGPTTEDSFLLVSCITQYKLRCMMMVFFRMGQKCAGNL